VSPSAVGQDLGIIQNLIFQYLQGVPNSDLYDGQISIYRPGAAIVGGTTCLVEHFRCVPEIIQFSNMISYDQRIKPLRDASRVQVRPHTIAYRVGGSSRDGKINRQEALGVASLLTGGDGAAGISEKLRWASRRVSASFRWWVTSRRWRSTTCCASTFRLTSASSTGCCAEMRRNSRR